MSEKDLNNGSHSRFNADIGKGLGGSSKAANVLLFLVPSPIKQTFIPLAQIAGGFAFDHIQKRKAVDIVLKANPEFSRAEARKVALGGLDAAKVLGKRMERPVSTYSVSQVFDTMIQDGSVSSGNPISNSFEFVSDAGKSVINLLQETPPKLASSDRIPASLTRAPNMTFGVVDSKEAYPACANMQGKVFNISMNEDTYYKICRRLRMTFGLTMFILFCLTLYLIFKIVIGILNSRRKHREELAFYNNLRNGAPPNNASARLSLPPKKENIYL